MMVRRGDWIYFDGDVEDYGNDTVFRVENSSEYLKYSLRPQDSVNPIYARYDDGDMNVKNSGFEVFFRIY
jgi:hypothetical protein